jgi:predicted RNA-binding Zn-ribbon protein involved in translation (DUF1610 family)
MTPLSTGGGILTATYPRLYCPHCGLNEIGLLRLKGDSAIWGCRNCATDFKLDFPGERRF